MNEAKKRLEKRKSGGEMAEQMAEQPQIRRSKLHSDYWKRRLFHDGFSRDGQRILSGDWSVRIAHAGRRRTFGLDTPNAAAATAKAQQIYASLVSVGWDATIAKFKPESLPRVKPGTVGEVITAAGELSTTRKHSFAQAALRLRQLASEIAGIKPPTVERTIGKETVTISARTAYRSPAFLEWRAKVDAVPLTALTAEAVRGWRGRRIAARSSNPIEKRAATVSADSTIRMARAVFSKRILAAGLANRVALPSPLPFAGITVGASTKRFSERIDAAQLFANARADLEVQQPEVFRALSLCMLAGLRRSEADRLTWVQVDLTGRTITIERTEWFEPKSEESARIVDIDDVAVEILRRAKSDNPDPVFVLKGAEPKPQTKAAPVYRCDAAPWRTWEKLVAWLAGKGVMDGKPIHVLRKLAGSLVFAAHGIEQARGFLGHASITTTSDSYLATTRRVTVSIGAPINDVADERRKGGAQ